LSTRNNEIKSTIRSFSRAQKTVLKDTVAFEMHLDSLTYSFEAVSQNVSQGWLKHPISKGALLKPGIYNTFDDFLNGKIISAPINIRLDPIDSLWKAKLKDKSLIWGICDGVDYYMRLYDSIYIKLTREELTYSFQLPYSIPDMHTLLSLEEAEHLNAGSSAVKGNGPFSVLGVLIASIGNEAIAKKQRKKQKELILKSEQRDMYRKCYLNLDNGDIIF